MKKRKLISALIFAMTLVGCSITLGDPTSSQEVVSRGENQSVENTNSSNENSQENNSSINEELSSNSSTNTSSDTPSTSTSEEENNDYYVDEKFSKYGVYSEAIYGEWNDSDSDKATVSYRKSGTSTYTTIDEELVRNKSTSNARFDILGLEAGTYDVKVVTSSSETLEMKNVEVSSYDRSGFAHYKNSKGVGAYNNDGTLKDDASVIYVSEENKNTVTFNGKTGLVNILGGLGSKSVTIRIIGRIATRSFDQDSKTYTRDNALGITDLKNLVNKDNGDNSYWNMCNFSSSTGGVTLEGVGDDAEIFQWGMTIKNCKYVEVRNLTFTDYPEDACAIEGSEADCTACQYVWLHNNTFNAGKNYVDQTSEQDKPLGDGATDMKQCMNITLSYNKYNKCHKTGLVGGGDSQLSNKITFHHNYYNQCKSRLPLGRQANMHMYNNYYYKISGTTMSIRAKAYALSEYNYFDSCSNPVETASSGVVKSYNNTFKSCSGKQNATVVTDRAKTVSNSNVFNQKFDTDSSYFYYDATNKVTDVTYLSSAEQAKIDCPKYAGVCGNNVIPNETSSGGGSNVTSSENSSSISSNSSVSSSNPSTGDMDLFNAANLSTSDSVTSNKTSGIFTVTASSDKDVMVRESSAFKSFDSSYTKEVNLNGGGNESTRSIKFTIEEDAKIYIYARSNSAEMDRQIRIGGSITYTFDAIDDSGNELTYNLSAGTYYICSANSGMSIAAIKLVY